MTARPLVAVPAMRSSRVDGLRREGLVMAERIAECVLRAGGEPVLLVPGARVEVESRLAAFDGLLVPGGRDVDPQRYGDSSRHPRTGEPDVLQDDADAAALLAALRVGLPTLAICRGLQVLNVALGGTLVQHLAEEDPLVHVDAFHDVELAPDSRVARAMGTDRVSVSSYHHQAIDRLGAGLVVVGRATDGVIEAVEHDTSPVLAVQWHPEDDAHEAPREQALFDALVELSRASTVNSRLREHA